MLNHWDDLLTLRSWPNAGQNANGYIEKGEPADAQVWADAQNITRSEFYASLSAGVKIAACFVVNACDYDGQPAVVWNGKEYNIVRTYSKGPDRVELYLSEVV